MCSVILNSVSEQPFSIARKKKGMINMFGKISKTDIFYLVAFGCTLGLLYFSLVTTA